MLPKAHLSCLARALQTVCGAFACRGCRPVHAALAPLLANSRFTVHTGDVWHICLPRLSPSLLYGYRVKGYNQDKSKGEDGKHEDAAAGHRCDEVCCVVFRV